MDSYRMITEVQRRLKDQSSKTVLFWVRGFEKQVSVEIIEVNRADGFVEVMLKHMFSDPRRTLISLDAITAVALPSETL